MALQKISKIFLSVVLVIGLLPSLAYAAPHSNDLQGTSQATESGQNTSSPEEDNSDSEQAGSAQGSSGSSSTSGTTGATDGDKDSASVLNSSSSNESSTDSVSQSNNANQEQMTADSQIAPLSLSPAANIQNGKYLLTPSSNTNLHYEVQSSQLAELTTPRADILTITFASDGSALIQNQDGNYLSAQGSSVIFVSEVASDSQHWNFLNSDNGSGYVVQNMATQTVLDISSGKIQNGTKVGLYQANKTAAQNWTLYEVGSSIAAMDEKAEASKGLLDTNTTYFLETTLASNKVVDVASASNNNGANVQLYDFNKTAAQQWRVQYDDKGYVTFENVGSGKVLDVSSAKAVSGTNVQQYQSNNSEAQKWLVFKNSDGTYSIESALWPGLSLDIVDASTANKTNVRIYTANGTGAQHFNLISEKDMQEEMDAEAAANSSVLPDGTYLINSALANNMVLDVASASTAAGANVQLYQSNMTNAQKWEVAHDSKGYVIFRNKGSGKVLDVASASIVPKTNVQQYLDNGSAAQKWIVSKNADGTYSIESALWKDISLDVANGSSANNTNIQIYSSNGTKAQSFNFLNTTPDVAPCNDLGLDGKYFNIATSINLSYVVDIASASMNNGASAQLYTSNNTYAQLFAFKFVKTNGDKGYYQIICAKSDKALDVDSGNLVNGTNIQQWAADENNAHQLFSITQNSDGTYTFINKSSGLAMDVASASASNGANIQGFTPNNSVAQKFNLKEVTNFLQEGIVTIYSALSSSKVVDVSSGSMSSGANVQLYQSNGSLAQKWNIAKVGDNTYTIQSVRSGMNLAVNGSNVIQSTPADNDAQKWMPSISKGMTVLKNVQTGKVLDVESASTANGANIQVYDGNGTNAQCFDVKSTSLLNSGIYLIQAFTNTNYVVDVQSGSSTDGANIQLYTSNKTAAQKWNVVQNSDGSFTFKNALSGKALDLESGVAKAGANIRQWTSNGSAAQKWYPQYVNGGGIKLVSAVDKNYAVTIANNSYQNNANIELQPVADTQAQRFTFEQTTPPLPSDQQAMLNRISGYSSGTSWLIAVDRSTHKVGVFKGSANNWAIQYYWSCVTGAPSSPTITGTYRTTGYKRLTLSTDSRARWCTQIWGGYFFHTILASESELGKSLSHGCIRMPISAAQWIYNNIGVGTTVIIYN